MVQSRLSAVKPESGSFIPAVGLLRSTGEVVDSSAIAVVGELGKTASESVTTAQPVLPFGLVAGHSRRSFHTLVKVVDATNTRPGGSVIPSKQHASVGGGA